MLLTRDRFVLGIGSSVGGPSVTINSAGLVEANTRGADWSAVPGTCVRVWDQLSSAGKVSAAKGSEAAGVHAPLIGSEEVIHPSPSRR